MIKLVIKIILLCYMVFILQSFIAGHFPQFVDPEIQKMEKWLDQKKDILYFGDSVVFTTAQGDSDTRTIPAMLADNLYHTTVGMVAHPADSAVVYEEYCTYLSSQKNRPKIIIVPISMRNFSVEWENNPGKQFIEEQLHFRFKKTPVYPFLPFLISFNVLKLYPRSYDEFYHMPFIYKRKSYGVIGDYYGSRYKIYSDENMKKQIQVYYLYQLSSEDSMLDAVKQIQNACGFAKVIYYITPINFDLGQKFLGPMFTQQVNNNVAIVTKALKDRQATFLDLSHRLPSNTFFWQDELYMNEHLNQKGRNYIADALAKMVEKLKN